MKIAIIHSQYIEPAESYAGNDYDSYYSYANTRVHMNIKRTLEMIREAGAAGADLVVTNEDFGGIGFYLRDVEHPSCFGNLVADFERCLIDELRAVAKRYKMYIAANEYETFYGDESGSTPEPKAPMESVSNPLRSEEGNNSGERDTPPDTSGHPLRSEEGNDSCKSNSAIYNTTKLIGRDGKIVGKYRKIHLPSGERFVVQPGAEHSVFKTDIGNIGFAICYDLLFPEHCRVLAMNGADMIIHQSQGWFPGGLNARVLGEPYIKVRATENRVYMVVAKNAQQDGGMSCIVDNRGTLLASKAGLGAGLLLTDIEPDYDAIDPYDYDNYFAGLRSLRARHLLHRKPSTYARLLDGSPVFTSELLSCERLCSYEEWVERIKALNAMTEEERSKLHW